MRKRVLSLFLCVVLIVSLLPTCITQLQAHAATEAQTNIVTQNVSEKNTSVSVASTTTENYALSGKTGYDRGYTGGMAGTGEYKAFGLDVSSWQGESLDFNMIKNGGYDFVILRAGTTYGKDSLFDTYYTRAKAAGLDVGAYYFSYALDVETSASDAENMISYLAGKQFEYPIYFDYESSSQLELSSSLSQQICLTFMDMLADEGYLVGLYTGKYFSTQIPTATICAKYEIWIAHYLATGDGVYDGTDDYTTYGPSYSTQYGMFQFTDSVWINGNGHFDGDLAFKDYPSIVKQYGFNGYEAEIQEESYFDECTFYPSHCKFTTTQNTGIFSEPRSAATDNTSIQLEIADKDIEFTSIGLYVNADGNIFYEVMTSDNQKGYIHAGHTVFVSSVSSDITLSGAKYPSSHVQGNTFVVSGTIASEYNKLDTAMVYIYSGAGVTGTAVTGGSASVSNNQYVLGSSAIDIATSFGDLPTGIHTYSIRADFSSYYAVNAQKLGTISETKYLAEHYFTVVNSSVDQSSCSHSNKTVVLEQATCTEQGQQVTYCSNCGLTQQSNTAAFGHSYDIASVTQAATCTTPGSQNVTCSRCDHTYAQQIDPKGHNYKITSTAATCKEFAINEYTCSSCGDYYKQYAGEFTSWTTEKPNVDERLIESKIQYRYSDFITLTSYEPNLAGYTLTGSSWQKNGTGTVTYVESWPSGFLTSSSAYTTYNNISQKVTASETATDKTAIDSDGVSGYLWYHWCASGYSTSTSYQTNTYGTFHVFFSTTAPSQADNYDSSDGSYKLASSTHCSNCVWYWPIAVYEQEYSTYKNLFTYQKWSDWSEWSDEEFFADNTRKVETRTLYRYIDAQLADHSFNSGSVTAAATCTTDGLITYTCTTCAATKTEAISALGHSWTSASCTDPVTCSACGSIGGEALGHSYTSTVTTPATCTSSGLRTYTCSRCSCSYTENIEKLGHSYTSTSTDPTCTSPGYTTHLCSTCGSSYKDSYINSTGHSYSAQITTSAGCSSSGVKTYTCSSCNDSYTETIPAVGHSYQITVTEPTCTEPGYTTHCCDVCGSNYHDNYIEALGHSYIGTTCTVCGTIRQYYLIGFINGADLGCNSDYENLGPYHFMDGVVKLTATSDCYVFVKTGDNQNWYMTDGWDASATSVTLYNTNKGIDANKLFIPFGVSVTLSLVVSNDDTLELSYSIDDCNHTYESETVSPTCTTPGYTTHRCSKCGSAYVEEHFATGHEYIAST